ncbi:MAG: hypothetical protein HZB38_09980, partial [Planctomycetes bacterium]|nr:hypothetical protein [Planctomycetota bacterium]
MASLYKRTWKDDHGRTVEAGIWTAEVKIGDGFERLPGFRDRKATDELARKVERLAELRAAGETLDAALTAFLDGLPKKQRRKLLEWGLVDDRAVHEATALATHLDAFRQELRDRGATAVHVEKTCNRVSTTLEAIGATTIRKLTASAVSHYLADRRKRSRKDGGLSANSSNHYVAAAKAFCAWLVASRRAKENPLAGLGKVNVAADRRHIRRALEAGEIGRLLTAAKNGQ